MELHKIIFEKKDGIATITLNFPPNLNALNEPMLDELMYCLDDCSDDSAVRAVIIRGGGNAFSAGGDIAAMKAGLDSDVMKFFGPGIRKVGLAALKIRNIKKPVIASIRGAAAGAGFNLALACDFRVAAEDALFLQAFVNLGLVPDMGGTYFLVKALGVPRATELVMTGKPITASEAASIGLVNTVVPVEGLDQASNKLAAKLANGPTQALGRMKALINRAAYAGLENSLDNETEYQVFCAYTDDFKEGVDAFLNKRRPNFRGK